VRAFSARARRHRPPSARWCWSHSDLFSALGSNERFDLIYWNSPYIEAPAGALNTFGEYALFDPGYSMHRTFMHTAKEHLTKKGRGFLGFCVAAGNLDLIHAIAAEADLTYRIYAQQTTDVFPEEMGTSPAFAAHADSKGMLHLDMTLLEFVQN